MTIRQFVTACCFLAPLVAAGCISSEETGTSSAPQPIFAPIDTTRHFSQKPRPALSDSVRRMLSADSAKARKQSRPVPRLRAKKDTIEVAVLTRSRSVSAIPTDVVEESKGNYTIQLGAFRSASNALRVQRTTKGRYKDQVVLSEYDDGKKMYRISVGQFSTLKEASGFRRQIMKDFPGEYAQCWVNYIQ